MSTRDRILKILEENRGQSVSGADIAKQLDISRNAIWKAINVLKKEGYQIEAQTNKGYKLAESNDILSESGIKAFLPDSDIDFELEVHKKVSSTNILAKKKAVSGAGEAHGTVIIAEEQEAGHGRRGRAFFSPPGHGIYMSIVLDPEKIGFDEPTLITAYTAVATCTAIEAYGKTPKIKWVNDLFTGGTHRKKFCGISAEAVMDLETKTIQWIVVGIGINFTLCDDLPEELIPIVGAVFENEPPPITRNRLAAEIIDRMLNRHNTNLKENLIEEYRSRLFILGKKIKVEWAQEPYYATALDIDDMGRLIVRDEQGEIKTLVAGGISIRPQD